MRPPLTRREVLAQSAAAGLTVLAARPGKAAPSERVNVAVIGVKGRGGGLAQGFAAMPGAQVTHLCDVDAGVLAGRLGEVAARHDGRAPRGESDLRRVLDDKSVDAIVVATPDHWHALATVWGCQAGKHVYVEKPASHNAWEGRQMVAAARKYGRVVQVGTQSRSAAHYLAMVEALRSGRIGKVHLAKAWNSQRRPDIKPEADSDVPRGVDYDLWTGPAPSRAFNVNRFHTTWHWDWDTGTGDVGNDGIHDIDIARWGLGVTLPTAVTVAAGNVRNTHWQVPDTVYATFRFPESDAFLVFEQRDWSPYVQEGYENGAAFYGTEGYILVGRAGWKIVEAGNKEAPVPKAAGFSDAPHRQDFLDCIRSGARPRADIEEGHRSATLAHLANIGARVGRCLNFDPKAETIVGDTEAAALLKRAYRPPFVVPETV
jgi:predicted dehydrogenase